MPQYFMPYGSQEEMREQQPLLYGPSGQPLKYVGQTEEETYQSPAYDLSIEDEGAGEELFEAKAELGLELQEVLSQAELEEAELEKIRKEKIEAEKREISLRKGSQELESARQQEAMRRAGESKYQRAERVAKRTKATAAGISGAVVKAATFGGPMGKPSRDYYIPRAKKEMYIPTDMRPLTSMQGKGASGSVLREAGALKFGALRGSMSPSGGASGMSSRGISDTPIGKASRGIGSSRTPLGIVSKGLGASRQSSFSNTPISRLREPTAPRDLSKSESAAYSEIHRNGDVDIPSHVVEDLGRLGISRQEALAAIKSLIKKGYIKQSGEFGGESVLEVIR